MRDNFIKKETLVKVFSCEFCEISKNTFFAEHLWATASEQFKMKLKKTLGQLMTSTTKGASRIGVL